MSLNEIPFLRAIDFELISTNNYKGRGAVALISNEAGEILVHLRDNKSWIAHPNLWAFIGGVVEEGEDEKSGILREVQEEVGLEADGAEPIFRLVDIEGSQNLITVFKISTRAHLSDLSLNEGQDFGFFSVEKLLKMPLVPFAKDLVQWLVK